MLIGSNKQTRVFWLGSNSKMNSSKFSGGGIRRTSTKTTGLNRVKPCGIKDTQIHKKTHEPNVSQLQSVVPAISIPQQHRQQTPTTSVTDQPLRSKHLVNSSSIRVLRQSSKTTVGSSPKSQTSRRQHGPSTKTLTPNSTPNSSDTVHPQPHTDISVNIPSLTNPDFLVSPREYVNVLCGESMNLHFFDYKLIHTVNKIKPDIDRAHEINPKTEQFAALREKISNYPFCQSSALRSYDAIIKTYMARNARNIQQDPCSPRQPCSPRETCANYDNTSGVYADDLLFLIYERIVVEQNDNCLDELIIQLSNMQSGMCPAGRVTRLLQIVVMFDPTF